MMVKMTTEKIVNNSNSINRSNNSISRKNNNSQTLREDIIQVKLKDIKEAKVVLLKIGSHQINNKDKEVHQMITTRIMMSPSRSNQLKVKEMHLQQLMEGCHQVEIRKEINKQLETKEIIIQTKIMDHQLIMILVTQHQVTMRSFLKKTMMILIKVNLVLQPVVVITLQTTMNTATLDLPQVVIILQMTMKAHVDDLKTKQSSSQDKVFKNKPP